jgi:hypothetical protein
MQGHKGVNFGAFRRFVILKTEKTIKLLGKGAQVSNTCNTFLLFDAIYPVH